MKLSSLHPPVAQRPAPWWRFGMVWFMLAGPAIVEQYDTTVLLPPGWEAEVANSSSLIMTAKR